jgi:hypothetical protein
MGFRLPTAVWGAVYLCPSAAFGVLLLVKYWCGPPGGGRVEAGQAPRCYDCYSVNRDLDVEGRQVQ